MEELEYSRLPCAGGLSVAGFLSIIDRLCQEQRFILEGERASSRLEVPLLFDNPGITVIPGTHMGSCTRRACTRRACTRRGYLPGCTRKAYTGCTLPTMVPGYTQAIHPGIYHPGYTSQACLPNTFCSGNPEIAKTSKRH